MMVRRYALCLFVAAAALGQSGKIQKPGEIQVPKGKWQVPGEIQVPMGIQAIKAVREKCEQRLTIVADALFEFDQATLTPQAEETLLALGPLILKEGSKSVTVEGHTDGKGTPAYNRKLSEQRAESVRQGTNFLLPPRSAAMEKTGRWRPTLNPTDPMIRRDGRKIAASWWCWITVNRAYDRRGTMASLTSSTCARTRPRRRRTCL